MAVNGSTLKAFRESKNLSQSAFAKQLGIHPSSLSNIEAGRTTPSAATLRSYHKAGFRQPVGRPPGDGAIKNDPGLPTHVALALEVLEQNAPHLLRDEDATAKSLHRLEKRIDQLTMLPVADNVMKHLEAIEQELYRIGQALRRVEILSATLTMPPEAPSEPELKNTDRGPDDPRE